MANKDPVMVSTLNLYIVPLRSLGVSATSCLFRWFVFTIIRFSGSVDSHKIIHPVRHLEFYGGKIRNYVNLYKTPISEVIRKQSPVNKIITKGLGTIYILSKHI